MTRPRPCARREILLTRPLDGVEWSAPVAATDSRAWSFLPSLARSPSGVLHLAWMGWHLLPDGCVYFDAQHRPGDPGCRTGRDRRIMHSVSYDGLAGSEGTAGNTCNPQFWVR